MGDLKVGDYVYSPTGKSVQIHFATDIYLPDKCYQVIFDDGSIFITDDDHRWWTQTAKDRKNIVRSDNPQWKGSIKTTREIMHSLRIGPENRLNHSIDITKAIEFPHHDLPIPPYTLGVWLGDGVSVFARITTMDIQILNEIQSEGIRVGKGRESNSGRAKSYVIGSAEKNFGNDQVKYRGRHTLQGKLRILGLIGNKVIPDIYLFSSIEQRTALLQGLMDTDGYCCKDKNGRAEIIQKRKELSYQILRLMRSLGIKATMRIKHVKNYGIYYRIAFSTDYPVFRLKRKLAIQMMRKNPRPTTIRKFIIEIEPIPAVRVRCISVEGEHYLAGDSFTSTHNTYCGPWWLYTEISKAPAEDYLVVAPTYKMLKRATLPALIDAFRGTDLQGELKESRGEYILPTGGRIWLGTGDRPETLEGGQYKAAWLDEAGQMKYMVWVVIQARLGFKQGRCFMTTTPYGMNWLYKYIYKPWQQGDKDYEVINFASTDNPGYSSDEFERARRAMDPNLFDMRYRGLFRKMEGLVYPDFEPRHAIDPYFDPKYPPKEYRLQGAIDFGYNNPMAIYKGALSPDDQLVIYHETYRTETLLKDVAPDMMDMQYVADPSGKREIEELKALGVDIVPGLNDPPILTAAMNARVRTDRLFVFKTCVNWLDEIETYAWDPGKDKPIKKDDHAMNATEQMILKLDGRPMRKGKVFFDKRPFTPMSEQSADEREQRVRDSVARGKLPPSMRVADEEAEKIVKPEEKKHGPRKGRVHIY